MLVSENSTIYEADSEKDPQIPVAVTILRKIFNTLVISKAIRSSVKLHPRNARNIVYF